MQLQTISTNTISHTPILMGKGKKINKLKQFVNLLRNAYLNLDLHIKHEELF